MNLFSERAEKTVFSQYLKLLQVKFTSEFSNKLFNEHPYKNSLYGLSDMLSHYNIKNAGVKITDKSKLLSFEPPFIVHASDTFFLVTKVSSNKISFLIEEKTVDYKIEEFNKIWSGVALFAEPDANSIEPLYKKHLLTSIYHKFTKILLSLCIIFLLFLFFKANSNHFSVANYTAIGVNIIGLYISYLLILKQINIQSKYAEKICSLLNKHSNCNNILESDASKLFGVIGWSEVGLGYFISNLIISIFTPSFTPYLALINICTLPYTIWSIWYQKYKANQWCLLCIVIQIILWLQFLVNYIFDFIYIPQVLIYDIALIASIFIIPFFIINILLPYISKGIKSENTIQELNSIKMKDEVFLALLKEQGAYQIDKSVTKIIFGNSNATLTITILTNPHCNPCAKMHKRVNNLLKIARDKVCIKYVFSSFEDKLDSSGMYLIGIYLNNSKEVTEVAYNEWFETGKNNKESFFKKYSININDRDIIDEYTCHKQWRDNTKISATPTILINGYKLPNNYNIEDLVYFTDIQ